MEAEAWSMYSLNIILNNCEIRASYLDPCLWKTNFTMVSRKLRTSKIPTRFAFAFSNSQQFMEAEIWSNFHITLYLNVCKI